MSTIAFLYRKPTDTGSYSGGGWAGNLPLSNLQTQDVQAVARSTSTDPGATQWRIDCGSSPPQPFSMFALLNHNISAAGRVRYVITDDADDDPSNRLYDSGERMVWTPTVVWGSLPWGAFPWDGIDTHDYPGGTISFHEADDVYFGRYVFVYITDEDNPAGYVQVGRFLAGQAWRPFYSHTEASLRTVDPSESRRTLGGRKIVLARPKYRQMDVGFSWMTEADALGVAFEIDRQIAKAGDMLVVYDAQDQPAILFRRAFYASLVDTSPISVVAGTYGTGGPLYQARLQLEELT